MKVEEQFRKMSPKSSLMGPANFYPSARPIGSSQATAASRKRAIVKQLDFGLLKSHNNQTINNSVMSGKSFKMNERISSPKNNQELLKRLDGIVSHQVKMFS